MSRKCGACDTQNGLSYNAEHDEFYCEPCADEVYYEDNVCYCDPDNEYVQCAPCSTGQRPHNPVWD